MKLSIKLVIGLVVLGLYFFTRSIFGPVVDPQVAMMQLEDSHASYILPEVYKWMVNFGGFIVGVVLLLLFWSNIKYFFNELKSGDENEK